MLTERMLPWAPPDIHLPGQHGQAANVRCTAALA